MSAYIEAGFDERIGIRCDVPECKASIDGDAAITPLATLRVQAFSLWGWAVSVLDHDARNPEPRIKDFCPEHRLGIVVPMRITKLDKDGRPMEPPTMTTGYAGLGVTDG